MNENENLMVRASEVSNDGKTETALNRNSDALATMVNRPSEERADEASENFESLTYVSSKGFFFQ